VAGHSVIEDKTAGGGPACAADHDLARQLRHLVLTEPFARLMIDRNQWLPEAHAEQIDLRYLALALLDQVMERSTMEAGCTAADAVRFGAGLVQMLAPDIDDGDAARVAQKVLDLLLNARERHQEFSVRYYDPARRQWLARTFRLLRIAADEDGETRIKPGDAALTLQLAMLDISPEFLAEAESLMIRKAIERGRFADAQAIAARARLRSMDYQNRLRERLFRIQRAPDAFSWRDEVLPQLKAARAHLEERQQHDATMMDAVREHLPQATEASARSALIQLRAMLEDAATRHNRLHGEVMQANERFRAAQQSAFRARRRAPVPDPEAQLLMPLLAAPIGAIAEHAGRIWSACATARVPRQIHLASLFASARPWRSHETSSGRISAASAACGSPCARTAGRTTCWACRSNRSACCAIRSPPVTISNSPQTRRDGQSEHRCPGRSDPARQGPAASSRQPA